jgi:polysaccharide pyruvyl transferase WcaK-like protein
MNLQYRNSETLVSEASIGKKIAFLSPVSPCGLGDALQCYTAIRMLNNLFKKDEITFVCPDLRENASVFGNLKLRTRFLDLGITGSYIVKDFLSLKTPNVLRKREFSVKNSPKNADGASSVRTISKITRRIVGDFFDSYIFGKYVGSSILKFLSPFDAAMIGGHTICLDPYDYIVQYENLRSITNGPIVTLPISMSELSFHYENRTMIKRMRKSLRKIDFIYVRGPKSLKVLRETLDVKDNKVGMALDCGFGMRLVQPHNIASLNRRKRPLKVVIVPRTDFFGNYRRGKLYPSYLKALAGLILWLSENYDVEVWLSSQVIDRGTPNDQHATVDLFAFFERAVCSDVALLKCVKIAKPATISDAYGLISGADLVVCSYMHAGIMALSAGVPAVFAVPKLDVKVLDVLSFLGLNEDTFLIDVFNINSLRKENFIAKIKSIIENHYY